ncbi:energy-coupled thiamine transporter ThiT [Clostridium fallax]|uniref:Thiamine transporter n=1 Tax=Clostridium fallax TaxID=1533 RepID=A0A1M4TBK4_9CLOT|nr:energy-coupled thiamine transporter ThiT [Clostridium fallax]SHE41841.1 thiamine transporter [Clostridium fallax]SQB22688.1 proton-coupled thiamine transporter YuaJ [Clostridium fallax]
MLNLHEIFNQFSKSMSKFANSPVNLEKIFTNPISLVTILGCMAIFVLIFKAKKIKFDTKLIARIGMVLALTVILHSLKIYKFPQGGSVTLGSMIPILLIGFMYGPYIGMLTGFLFGIINMIMDPYILNPVQVLFDYPLPYMCLGLTGFFRNRKMLGAFIAIFARFLCHFISGVAFFGSFAPEGMSPWIYSLVVNGSVIGADGIICLVILYFLPVQRLIKTVGNNYKSKLA